MTATPAPRAIRAAVACATAVLRPIATTATSVRMTLAIQCRVACIRTSRRVRPAATRPTRTATIRTRATVWEVVSRITSQTARLAVMEFSATVLKPAWAVSAPPEHRFPIAVIPTRNVTTATFATAWKRATWARTPACRERCWIATMMKSALRTHVIRSRVVSTWIIPILATTRMNARRMTPARADRVWAVRRRIVTTTTCVRRIRAT